MQTHEDSPQLGMNPMQSFYQLSPRHARKRNLDQQQVYRAHEHARDALGFRRVTRVEHHEIASFQPFPHDVTDGVVRIDDEDSAGRTGTAAGGDSQLESLLRCVRGLEPVHCLSARLKELSSEKPTDSAISLALIPVRESIASAASQRMPR